jgi:hypothetical protein
MPPSTTFDQLIPIAMGSDYPIPIVNDDNMLIGEVHRSALAEVLAETTSADPDYGANAAANAELALQADPS